jgi:hypothetical protein
LGIGVKIKRWRIEKRKITGYLLNENHPQGRSKALWFQSFGFSLNRWREFSDSIQILLQKHKGKRICKSTFGHRVVVWGFLETPRGQKVQVTTVWQVERGILAPRLITAYPTKV